MSLSDQQLDKIERHAEELREKIFQSAQVCATCMPYENGEPVWLTGHWPLSDTIREVLEEWGGLGKEAFDDKEVAQVVSALDLQCPGCKTTWDEAETEVGSEPRPEPLDLAMLGGRTPKVTGRSKRVIVAFGDMSGFSKWVRRAAVSDAQVKRLMAKLYAEFGRLEHTTHYFTKPLGDGIMFVRDLTGRRLEAREAEEFVKHARDLTARVEKIVTASRSPRPGGFRVRVVVGDAWKFKISDPANPRLQRVDYIGYPINFAARLLGVLPKVKVMCDEATKELIEHSAILGPKIRKINKRLTTPKGIDAADMKGLCSIAP